jgi:single-strand DNA-binding protein
MKFILIKMIFCGIYIFMEKHMSHVNQVILIANLGKDPEVLNTTDQSDFVRLSLATNKRYKDKNGENKTETQWHVVYLSNRLGKIGSR